MAFGSFRPNIVFGGATALRIGLLLYGSLQDRYSPLKYTDIDYFVFTDASRYVFNGQSPYERDTYRYTPLLAWLLLPTAWYSWSFSFGKVLFAVGDIIAGLLIFRILESTSQMSRERALKFASIWLLNPMVATISTRGSSEGLLAVMVVSLIWAITKQRIRLAGVILGLAVHFKIYPFIYAVSIMWWMDAKTVQLRGHNPKQNTTEKILSFLTPARMNFAASSLATYLMLNIAMYIEYGLPFIKHTYLYHVTRLDHRHNFSVYNTLLYLASSPSGILATRLESLAFIPQLLLSAFLIPVALAKKDLVTTMLAQTFAFVTFNKVCTSQYFLWYLIFLPFYLPNSSLLSRPALGAAAGMLWALSQALWLQQGYQLEFLGNSTFVPGLWAGGVLFFLTNIWILGIIISDAGTTGETAKGGQAQMILK